MKNHFRKNVFLAALIVPVCLMLACPATAQVFTTLHSLSPADGGFPQGALVRSGTNLYGTAATGGNSDNGTIFKMNLDGTGFTNLYNFTGGTDGAAPNGMILSGGTLYGTACTLGNITTETVFKMNLDGSGFAPIHTTTASNGFVSMSALVLCGNTLYGSATEGLFKVDVDGSNFTILHAFSPMPRSGPQTNADGNNSRASLVISGNFLFGTAGIGGTNGDGTVFKVGLDGSNFTTLHHFAGNDGNGPYDSLTIQGNTLYGTTSEGGSFGGGVVFGINLDGTGFTNLHNFDYVGGYGSSSGLVASGTTLYGTTVNGGNNNGVVFQLNTDGSGFTNLHVFSAFQKAPFYYGPATNADGGQPITSLIVLSNTLYGTTQYGGTLANGALFSIALPQGISQSLSIAVAGTNVVLTWPTTGGVFNLQSCINPSCATAWNTVPIQPVIINGQNTVTNPINGPQAFYRLSQ